MSINPETKDQAQRGNYYDAFSDGYDHGRDRGYHAFLDRMELDTILPFAKGKDVLEAGCGTGLLLEHITPIASRAVGVDLSSGMLRKAHERGLTVAQGTLAQVPFPDASFDLVYSCKVLAHVPDLEGTLRELSRVTRPGGHLVLEFYNRRSLRYFIRSLRPGMSISAQHTDAEIYTRFDTETEVQNAAPDDWNYLGPRGIRVATLVPQLFVAPLVGRLWERFERSLSHSPLTGWGGFLVMTFQKAS